MTVCYLSTLLALFVGITVHEFGHFLTALLMDIPIKSFHLCLSPGFHIFSTHDRWIVRLFPSLSSKTEFVLGWLPLGGYVSFCEAPEHDSKAKAYLKNRPPQQLLAVFCAGVMVNFFVALLLLFLNNVLGIGSQLLSSIATINMIMGIFNLIPLLPLDGGQIFFCLYELIYHEEPTDHMSDISFLAGIAFLAVVLIYDALCWLT